MVSGIQDFTSIVVCWWFSLTQLKFSLCYKKSTNFTVQVHNIVDKACKEMGMEKFLHDCKNNWKGLEFDYEDHTSGQTRTADSTK